MAGEKRYASSSIRISVFGSSETMTGITTCSMYLSESSLAQPKRTRTSQIGLQAPCAPSGPWVAAVHLNGGLDLLGNRFEVICQSGEHVHVANSGRAEAGA